jgi:hypothetical protein
MIYLLQDCYKDNKGEYHDILKIGYSKDRFSDNRQGQYNTHNFGYKFLGEREGSCELENYLHKLLKKYNLDREWFRYSQDVIDKFWKAREEDISEFTSQEELNEYIRYYILNYLVPSVNKLKELYLNQILSEIKEKDFNYEENKEIYRKEIINVFEFVSTRQYEYFSNLDFNSSEIIEKLKECSLDLPQIVGRQRNRENPFKNNIIIFYRTIRKTEIEDRETFDKTQEERRKETQRLLDFYEKGTPEEQRAYVQKLKNDIKTSKYERDFISISKKTGKPVYNSFIDIANERGWEVSQKDYQDKISVTKSLESLTSNISEYQSDLEKEVQDFLDNKFYSTGIFEKKMKMYCEFMDKHGGNKEVSDMIYFKIKDPKYRKYYNFYGTKGCKTVSYKEKSLKIGMIDVSKESELSSVIYKKFQINSRYTLKEIKSVLQDIYRDLGITSKPKATDLDKYYNLSSVLITENGKRTRGYLLKSL